MHARLEGAADQSVSDIEQLARPQVHIEKIASAWAATIVELRHSNSLLTTVFDSDRAARAETDTKRGDEFDRALMRREMPMVAKQVAEAASVLASIWLYEWTQAEARPPARVEFPTIAPKDCWSASIERAAARPVGIALP